LEDAKPGPLFSITDNAGEETALLLLRCIGDDPSLTEWERRQNYARYAAPGEMALECVLATEPPDGLLEMQRQHHELRRAAETSLPPFVPPTSVARGLLRMGIPVSLLTQHGCVAHRVRVLLEIDGPRLALFVDDVLVDEEWPSGPWRPGAVIDAAAAMDVEILPGILADAAMARRHGGADAILRREAEMFGPRRPLGQYWAPNGHNAWAGDAMLTADGDRLHLLWLTDRRLHGSKYGCGGCAFAHASTLNLATWEFHPLAYPVTEYWEAANGTGCMVAHGGVLHVFANVLSERLGIQDRHPNGPHLAVSRDGIHFQKEGRVNLPGEPGILRDEQGIFHAIAVSRHADGMWRSARYESSDLRRWRLADPDFLPAPGWPPSRTVFSSECFNWFRWGDWYYIIGGRTGFWRARTLHGPYRSVHDVGGPAWDIYDGLMVPQVAIWQGRGIMAGWLALNEHDWGGHLVFREVRQRADGNLELRRPPEMERQTTLGCGRHLQLRLDPRRVRGRFGIRLGCGSATAAGVELWFDPAQRAAQWRTPRRPEFVLDTEAMPFRGGDFAILNVEGLDRPFNLDIVMQRDDKSDSTIVDAQIDERRTMITRRTCFGLDAPITPFAEAGELTCMVIPVHA
jgi:hypothetical protein